MTEMARMLGRVERKIDQLGKEQADTRVEMAGEQGRLRAQIGNLSEAIKRVEADGKTTQISVREQGQAIALVQQSLARYERDHGELRRAYDDCPARKREEAEQTSRQQAIDRARAKRELAGKPSSIPPSMSSRTAWNTCLRRSEWCLSGKRMHTAGCGRCFKQGSGMQGYECRLTSESATL